MCYKPCSGENSNTGVSSSAVIGHDIVGLLIQDKYDGHGNINGLSKADLSKGFTQSLLDDLLKNADATKRIKPLMDLKNVEEPREAPAVEEFSDNSSIPLSAGKQEMKFATIREFGSITSLNNLLAQGCGEKAIYPVDSCGTIWGIPFTDSSGTEKFRGRYLNKGSWKCYMEKAKVHEASEKVITEFSFKRTESDKDMMAITAEDITADLDSAQGLLNAYVAVLDKSTNHLDLEVRTSTGNWIKDEVLKHLTGAEFEVYDLTADSPHVIDQTIPLKSGGIKLMINGLLSGHTIEIRQSKTPCTNSSFGHKYSQYLEFPPLKIEI